jgi:hypothetical protein
MAVNGAVLLHDDLAVLLTDGRLDLADLLVEENRDVSLAVEISCRASRTQVGQSESVSRGQPSGGFVF